MRLSSAFNPIFLTLLSRSYISVSSRSLSKHRRNNFNFKVSINILLFRRIPSEHPYFKYYRRTRENALRNVTIIISIKRPLIQSCYLFDLFFERVLVRSIWCHRWKSGHSMISMQREIFSAKARTVKIDVRSAHTARDSVSISVQDVPDRGITTFRMPGVRSAPRRILGMPRSRYEVRSRVFARARARAPRYPFAVPWDGRDRNFRRDVANQVGVIHPRLSFAFSVSSGSLTTKLRSTASIPYRNQMLRRLREGMQMRRLTPSPGGCEKGKKGGGRGKRNGKRWICNVN